MTGGSRFVGSLPLLGSVGIAALASLAAAASAAAGTYTVHDAPSLAAAVASAGVAAGPSTIKLAAGTYRPGATLTLRGDVALTGPSGADGAAIDGSGVVPAGSEVFVVDGGAHAALVNLTVTTAGQVGAAPAIDVSGTLDLESSALVGNNGAALVVEPHARATVRDATIADGLSAGLVDHGDAQLINATVAGNAVEGIDRLGGTLGLVNTIVAGNGFADCSGVAQTADHSLDGDGTCGVGALSDVSPGLAPVNANGGPTPTRALVPGSPAIDAGDQSRCSAEDQRHYARFDGRCDIGAYEAGTKPAGAGAAPAAGGGSGLASVHRAVGVSGHGSLRGSHPGARMTFVLRARVSAPHGTFVFGDPARHVRLKAPSIGAVRIDVAGGTATISGSGTLVGARGRVRFTAVVTSHLGRRSVEVRLSSGYAGGGALTTGKLAFSTTDRGAP